jgi:hypothetical protein
MLMRSARVTITTPVPQMQPRSVEDSPAGSPPLVSCLCVTEGREAFVPWLLWSYQKQKYRRRELVVVDSSQDAAAGRWPPAATVVRCPAGTSVARKRNLAVDAARGDLVAWFDAQLAQLRARLAAR